MAWGSKTQISSGTSVSSTARQGRSTSVDLASKDDIAHVQVSADFPTTPTTNLLVYVQTTLDASTETWDSLGFLGPFLISNSIDPHVISFTVSGVYKFSLIYALDNGTQAIAVSAWYRKDGA